MKVKYSINGIEVVEIYNKNVLSEVIINNDYYIKVYNNTNEYGQFEKGCQYLDIGNDLGAGTNELCRLFNTFNGGVLNANEAIEGICGWLY